MGAPELSMTLNSAVQGPMLPSMTGTVLELAGAVFWACAADKEKTVSRSMERVILKFVMVGIVLLRIRPSRWTWVVSIAIRANFQNVSWRTPRCARLDGRGGRPHIVCSAALRAGP